MKTPMPAVAPYVVPISVAILILMAAYYMVNGLVADLTLVQVIYILGAIIIVITALGQMVLRH